MSAVSGQFGTIKIGSSDIIETTSWKLTRKASLHGYGANTTAGFNVQVAGTKSGTVSIEGKYDPTDPIDTHVEEGDAITFLGYTTASLFYTIPCVVESLDLTVDMNEGDIVGWTIAANTSGAWTIPSYS